MKVAKLVARNRIELFEEPKPEPQENQLLIKMSAAGICGSDLHYFLEGGLGTFKVKMPFLMGHEPAGVVVDPNGNREFKEGDRVAIEPGLSCLHCEDCHRGLHNLCSRAHFMGSNAPGAFQQFIAAEGRQLVKLDSEMTDEGGAMLEPFGVAFHALRLASLDIGARVAIFGTGPIGLYLIAAAKLAGAGEVYAIDKLGYRLEFARDTFQVDHLINEDSADPVEYIKSYTSGRGVDVAFDAAGMQKTVDECFRVTAPAGKVVLVGIPTYDELSYNPHVARTKELTILNVRRSNQTLMKVRELYRQKKVNPAVAVSHRFPLDDIQKAFEIAAGYADGVMKAVVAF